MAESPAEVRKLYNSGGSTVVSPPADLLEAIGAQKGDHVMLTVEDGKLVVKPMVARE
jgi:antitoxin component of MazEF toxin-antitoxin module